MIPADLDLPAKFTKFRGPQFDLSFRVANDGRRFRFLSAPTGTGKSLIYMTIARLLGARVLILVGTKGLQQQLMADFESIGMVDMRGSSNYRCVASDGDLREYATPGSNCNDGPCRVGVYCPLREEGCHYYQAQDDARSGQIVVTNYAYWLSLGRHSDPDSLGHFDLMILDEAHTAPEWLSSFCAVSLDKAEIKTLLDLNLPPIDEGVSVWAEWAKGALVIARRKYVETKVTGGHKRVTTHKLIRLTDITSDLQQLSMAHAWKRSDSPARKVTMPGIHTDWVAQKTDHGVKFSPVWGHAYGESYLFRGIEKIVLTSATLAPVIRKYMGINPVQSSWFEIDSGFPVNRRPFYFIPTTTVDRNMTDGQVSLWVSRMDFIIEGRQHLKGIIHARSYERARLIMERSRFKHLLITHGRSNARETVARFKLDPKPCVLVSPSLEEGYDFPHDQCRYQIIAKVPFLDTRDPVMKERCRTDKDYSNYSSAMSIVQQSGRSMRAADDWCETFIIDDHWRWFRQSARQHFPKWFRIAWKDLDSVPPALKVAS